MQTRKVIKSPAPIAHVYRVNEVLAFLDDEMKGILLSPTDLDTMVTSFGECDWAVMFILARGGKRHAELRWNRMQNMCIRLKTSIDYQQPFPESDYLGWQNEYDENVVDQSQSWTGLMDPNELWNDSDFYEEDPHTFLEFNA